MDALETAQHLTQLGYSVLPIQPDGTKAPAHCIRSWTQYQTIPATPQQHQIWWTQNPNYGIATITGTPSNGVILLEIEGKAIHQLPEITSLANNTGLGHIYQKLVSGWLEQSPSGGLHYHLRVIGTPTPIRSTKIATQPNPQNPKQIETLAEIKGENGYVIIAPTAGAVHPTGKPYIRLAGGPETPANLTLEEYEAITSCFRAVLHQPTPQPAPATTPTPIRNNTTSGLQPGDDYENKTSWHDILTPEGWTVVYTSSGTTYWRRPGKNVGISATTGHAQDRDRLYVFTTSSIFETEKPYTKFGAYAALHHGSNHTEAARALASKGYGTPAATYVDMQREADDQILDLHNIQATVSSVGSTSVNSNNLGKSNNITTKITLPDPVDNDSDDGLGFEFVDELITYTDTGNARRLATVYGPDGNNTLTYIPEAKAWAHWTGTRWEQHTDHANAIERATRIAEALPETHPNNAQMDDKQAKEAAKKLKTFKSKSLSKNGIRNSIELATSIPELRTSLSQFDQQPYQVNTPTGPIDLYTGKLLPPNPALRHSKQTSVASNPKTPTPLWTRFLNDIFLADQELIEYMQIQAGIAIIGTIREHSLQFHFGGGANGKTLYFETIRKAFGEYAKPVPEGLVITKRDEPEYEIAALAGIRVGTIEEIDENARFSEKRLKKVTGGGQLEGRFLYQNLFQFKPTHTIWLAGNSKPKIEVGGHSLWRRLRLINFKYTVPDNKRDETLGDKIEAQELPGVLAWIIEGAKKYLASGVRTPESVISATQDYEREEDHLSEFVTERLEKNQHSHAYAQDIYSAYTDWCRSNGYKPREQRAFGRDLPTKIGYSIKRTNRGRIYDGLLLLHSDTEDEKDSASNSFWEGKIA